MLKGAASGKLGRQQRRCRQQQALLQQLNLRLQSSTRTLLLSPHVGGHHLITEASRSALGSPRHCQTYGRACCLDSEATWCPCILVRRLGHYKQINML